MIQDERKNKPWTIEMQLWNLSLPVAANVGILKYNRGAGPMFKERVDEDWWKKLEGLATRLNEAAEVIVGKAKSEKVTERKRNEVGGETPETSKGKDKEPETRTSEESAGKDNYLSNDPKALAAKALAASNPLSALWYRVDRFITLGDEAASYFMVALEAAVRIDSTTVHPLHIPAPPNFWSNSSNWVEWTTPGGGMALFLTLASSENGMFDAFAHFTRSLGEPLPNVQEMLDKPSKSLRKAVIRAKHDAKNRGRTTILGVDLRDLLYRRLLEMYGKDEEKVYATFGRMFVLGISPGAAKLWFAGPVEQTPGPEVGSWEQLDEFVRDFEGFAVTNVGPPSPFPSYLPMSNAK